jgi:anti-sigma regulatory factor (Ser/Thr protein kinase)
MQFPATPARLADLRRTVRDGLRGKIGDEDLEDLVLALHEATTNAVLHGSEGGAPVQVVVRLEAGCVEATVLDFGQPEPPASDPDGSEAPARDLPPGSGRGLWLMGRLVDEVRLEHVAPRGTKVTLRRNL